MNTERKFPFFISARYKAIHFLGKGGFGAVYLVEDLVVERKVAVKALAKEVLARGTTTQEQEGAALLREAKILGQLSEHAHVASLYDVLNIKGEIFLVLEYVPGETLKARLARSEKDPLDFVLKQARMIATALEAIHRAGFLHFDLKPGNIMIHKDYPKLLDFGIAKIVHNPVVSLPGKEPPAIVGTAGYMSPEHAGQNKPDPRSDLFSLGIIMYEWICGERPFQRETGLQELNAILNEQPKQPDRLGPMPAKLWKIIAACLSKRMEGRPTSAGELADQLNLYMAGPEQGTPPPRFKPDQAKVIKRLRHSALFRAFSDQDFQEFLAFGSRRTMPKGQVIIPEGSSGAEFYLILKGTVSIEEQGHHILSRGAGEVFGEVAVIDKAPRMATVRAETEVRLLVINESVLRLRSDRLTARFYQAMAEILCKKLRESDQRKG